MKLTPYLRSVGLVLFGASFFISACEVRLKDPDENERNKTQYEAWTNGPGGSSYVFAKCSGSDSSIANNICGSRVGDASGTTNYDWHTNCTGSSCGSVSVFAHYMLMDNLGAQETLHIEAFDNATFQNSPVATLEISGFDATKPSSTSREEIFLAPGEYYFRAYLAPAGATPLPYSLQGMQLVSDTPVGVLGALSGAQRVLVKSTADSADPVHIYIDQLLKKDEPEADSLAKFRLSIAVDPAATLDKYRDVHVLLLSEADLEVNPSYNFTLSTNTLIADNSKTDFVSPSLKPADYYVFTYIDANSNGFVDDGELGAFVTDASGKPATVTVEANHTKELAVTLSAYAKSR